MTQCFRRLMARNMMDWKALDHGSAILTRISERYSSLLASFEKVPRMVRYEVTR